MELEMNTYLYFGMDYRVALRDILAIFKFNINKVIDSHKKIRIQRIIKKMEAIIAKMKKSDLFLNTLITFKDYISNDFKLSFNNKVESIKIDLDLDTETTIEEHINQSPDNICMIGLNENNEVNINSVNLTDIHNLAFYFKDMNSGWFYKCNTNTMINIDLSTAYVKIPGQITIFINYYELYDYNDYELYHYNDVSLYHYNNYSLENYREPLVNTIIPA
jgi:hypothetical protein